MASFHIQVTACAASLALFVSVARAEPASATAHYDYLIHAADPDGGSVFKGTGDTDFDFDIASTSFFDNGSIAASGNSAFAEASAISLVPIVALRASALVSGEAHDFVYVQSRATATRVDPTFDLQFLDPTRAGFFTINATLKLSGNLRTEADGDINYRPSFSNGEITQASVLASVTASQNGRFLGAAVTSGVFNHPDLTTDHVYDNELPLVLSGVLASQPLKVEISLSVSAKLAMQRQSTCPNCSGSGKVVAQFDHTLIWGGISSVVDEQTGQPVDGWFVTSDTDFDYSRPSPIPEPSSIELLAALVSAHGVRRRRHRDGDGGESSLALRQTTRPLAIDPER